MNYAMYSLLNELKRQALCHDKQVACILTDESDHILSVGVNHTTNCDMCSVGPMNDHCVTRHAEIEAISQLSQANVKRCYRAYISLFPCENCQLELGKYVKEIIVFNRQHKQCVTDPTKFEMVGDLADMLCETNGVQKQLAVVQGELAELITAISDYFYRGHERISGMSDIMDEIADAELMIQCLLSILKDRDSGALVKYDTIKRAKLRRVDSKLRDGAIKAGSPFTNPLPGKEMN